VKVRPRHGCSPPRPVRPTAQRSSWCRTGMQRNRVRALPGRMSCNPHEHALREVAARLIEPPLRHDYLPLSLVETLSAGVREYCGKFVIGQPLFHRLPAFAPGAGRQLRRTEQFGLESDGPFPDHASPSPRQRLGSRSTISVVAEAPVLEHNPVKDPTHWTSRQESLSDEGGVRPA